MVAIMLPDSKGGMALFTGQYLPARSMGFASSLWV